MIPMAPSQYFVGRYPGHKQSRKGVYEPVPSLLIKYEISGVNYLVTSKQQIITNARNRVKSRTVVWS